MDAMIKMPTAWLLALVCSLGPLRAADVLRYSILMNGKPAGSEVDTYQAGGNVESVFEYNDRGRGPKITARYTFAASGLPSRAEITGVDYLKAPVDEHLSIESGQAH